MTLFPPLLFPIRDDRGHNRDRPDRDSERDERHAGPPRPPRGVDEPHALDAEPLPAELEARVLAAAARGRRRSPQRRGVFRRRRRHRRGGRRAAGRRGGFPGGGHGGAPRPPRRRAPPRRRRRRGGRREQRRAEASPSPVLSSLLRPLVRRPPFDQSLEVREAPRGALRGMLDYRGVDQEQAGQEEDDESRGGASHEVQHRAEVGDRDGDGGRERDEEGGPERGTRFRGAPLGDGAEDVLGRGAGWVMVERVVREDDAAF